MKAIEAVGRYKKIRLPKTPKGVHAELNGFNVLVWVENRGKGIGVTGPVSLHNQIRQDWEALESEEVRDLKQRVKDLERQNHEFRKVIMDRASREAFAAFADLQRDSKIERIVVDDVFWKGTESVFAVPDRDGEPHEDDIWRKLPSKGKCKMILEFPK
ncbi:hypothetical protein KAR91_53085 [Candidatus Pacearchaeota archaeon]|nr:hypothetical protein [Candidatus Pacearchaeota archaeon]